MHANLKPIEDETISNVVPIVNGRAIACPTLETLLHTFGLQFQKHVDEVGCEPTLLYMALSTPEGPVVACVDTSVDPNQTSGSAMQTKVFFHLQHQLTNFIYKL